MTQFFYTNLANQLSILLLILLSMIAIFISFKRSLVSSYGYLKLVPLYISMVLAQLFIGQYEVYFLKTKINKQNLANISAYIFVTIEFIIFCLLLINIISNNFVKRSLSRLIFLFPVLSLIIWYSNELFAKAISIITTVESFVLIPACLYYFYELFKRPPLLILTKEPAFWITTGILFLLVSITPFYLFLSYFLDTSINMQIIDHVAYDIIVILFTKSVYVNKNK
jgi:hypothetical protein